MADGDVVRTVFQTEWLGGNVLSRMIRQYGMADKAMQGMGKSQAMSGVAAAKNTQQLAAFADMQKQMGAAVFDGRISLEKAEETMATYASQAGIATEASGGFLASLSPLTIALAAVAAGVAAAAFGFSKLYPVLEQGANVAQLDASFDHLISTMTKYPDVLDDMKSASQFTVSNMAAQEGIMTLVAGSSRMMTEELTRAAPKLLEISKAANKLNPMLGDTNFMFTSLAKGVKRAEPRLIDNLGLKLRVSDANRELAEQLGKSVMALTAEEKQLAILNETLKAGDKLIAQVGGDVAGLSDSFQRVTAANQDFVASFKENLFLMLSIADATDMYAGAVRGMSTALSVENDIRKAYNKELITQAQYEKFMTDNMERDTVATQDNMRVIQAATKAREEKTAALAEAVRVQLELNEAEFFATGGQAEQRGGTARTTLPFEAGGIKSFGDAMEKGLERMKQTNAQYRLELDDLEDALKQEKWEAYSEAVLEASDKREKALKADMQILEQWADVQNKASVEAHEAWVQYTSDLGDITEGQLAAEASASFFTVAIENIGAGFRTVGGATEEQTDELDRLERKLESTRTKLGDLELGLGTFGRKEEAIAKSHGKLTSDIAILEEAIGGLSITQSEAVAVQQDAIWSWESISAAIEKSAQAAGLASEDYLRYKVSIGEITMAQGEAALAATALQVAIDEGTRKIAIGELDPEDLTSFVQRAQRKIDAADFSILLTPDIELEPVAMTAQQHVDEQLRQKLGGYFLDIPAQMDLATAKDTLNEEFFGEDALEPAIITIEVFTDDATGMMEVWRMEEGQKAIVVPVEVGDAGRLTTTGGIFPEGHAYGGSLRGGHAVLVGERGPEIIAPPGNSEVISNDKLGGGTTQINLAITVGGSIGTEDFVTIVEDTLLEAMQQYGL